MPDLSNSGLFGGGQVDFTRTLVQGQVSLGEIQYNNIQFVSKLWQDTGYIYTQGSSSLTQFQLIL